MKKSKKIAEKKKKKKQQKPFEVRFEQYEQLLTIEQVAFILNIGVRTAWRLDAEEKLPDAYRVGSRKRWNLSDIKLWLELGSPTRKKFNKLKMERNNDNKEKSK